MTQDERDPLIRLVELALHLSRRLETHAFTDERITPLTPIDRLVMQHIDRHPGTTLSELAEGVNLRMSNASVAVSNLVAEGFVERGRSDTDRRAITLSPTRAALENVALVHAEWLSLVRDVDLDPVEVQAALRVFGALDAHLSADE